MILAGIATYFNSRASIARQSPEAAANPQTALMNKMALYVFPLGVVAGGPFLPLAIILYWYANNIWTFGQQHYVFGKIEKEEEAKKQEALERRAANAPAPGAKPVKGRRAKTAGAPSAPEDSVELTGADIGDVGGSAAADGRQAGDDTATKSFGAARAPANKPRPGAKPKKRRR
jgi:YidC/Oxa1 family membrane protein insertase